MQFCRRLVKLTNKKQSYADRSQIKRKAPARTQTQECREMLKCDIGSTHPIPNDT
jgi:hypothetical protein